MMQQYISAHGTTSTRGRDELWEEFSLQAGGVGLWHFTPSVGRSVMSNKGYSFHFLKLFTFDIYFSMMH